MKKKFGLLFVFGFLFLFGCNSDISKEIQPDFTEVLGTETSENCEFGCILPKPEANEFHEISKFASPELGISFTFVSGVFFENTNIFPKTLEREENTICRRGNSKNPETEKKIEIRDVLDLKGCIEIFPYKKWKKLDDIFGIGDTLQGEDGEEIPYMYGEKRQLTGADIFFVSYHCSICADWIDFSRVETMEVIEK